MARTATIVRETSESKVELSLNLDGTGKTDIDTSVPFYNHMMTALGKHSLIDLKIKAAGSFLTETELYQLAVSPTPPCRSTRHSPKPSSTFPAARTACAPESRKASNTA